ncbi:Hypothetical predicted protein, partial [Marmota monax]
MPRSWEVLAETRVGPWPSHPGFPYHLAVTWRAQRCPHHCLPSSSISSSQPACQKREGILPKVQSGHGGSVRDLHSRGRRRRADLHLGLSGARDHA